jgi:hypothetical protein
VAHDRTLDEEDAGSRSEWWTAADRIVREWESAAATRLLLSSEAAELTRLVAEALRQAFERGARTRRD